MSHDDRGQPGDGPDSTVLLTRSDRERAGAAALREAGFEEERPQEPGEPGIAVTAPGGDDLTDVLRPVESKPPAGPTVQFNPSTISSVSDPLSGAGEGAEAGFEPPSNSGEFKAGPTELYERGREYGLDGDGPMTMSADADAEPSATDPDRDSRSASAQSNVAQDDPEPAGFQPSWLRAARPVDLQRPAEGATAAFSDLADDDLGGPVPLPENLQVKPPGESTRPTGPAPAIEDPPAVAASGGGLARLALGVVALLLAVVVAAMGALLLGVLPESAIVMLEDAGLQSLADKARPDQDDGPATVLPPPAADVTPEKDPEKPTEPPEPTEPPAVAPSSPDGAPAIELLVKAKALTEPVLISAAMVQDSSDTNVPGLDDVSTLR